MMSLKGPTITVITIFFEAERFLEESIVSVLEQTLEDLELVLVDDGSTDRGTAIARSYADRYPDRIRCVEHARHANLGMSASRNAGLREARGRFVAFLDADDRWAPTMLEGSVAFLEGYPGADITYSGSIYWHGWTGRREDADLDQEWKPGVDIGVPYPPPTLLTRVLADGWLVPCPGTFVVRRDFARRIGGFEERFRRQFDDQAFLAKALLHGTAVVSDATCHLYRQHQDSDGSTAARAGIVTAARIDYLAWLDAYVRRHGFADPALRQTLDAARAEAGPMAPGPEPVAPAVGSVGFGDFRRVTPFSRIWGFDRGSPVDRRYIEDFLERNSPDVRGTVLEVKDSAYTRRFGGDAVTRAEVIDLAPTGCATIVADLQDGRSIPENRFDCVILTQTLQLVYDFRAALATVLRILRPSGVVLLTVPGISQLDHAEAPDAWYWSFTPRSVRRLLEDGGWTEIDVEGNGNVLTSMAFLYGMAGQELSDTEFSEHDPDYPLLITARARKPGWSE